jgi:hypothetical protein
VLSEVKHVVKTFKMVPEFASLNKHPNIRQNKYLLNLKVSENRQRSQSSLSYDLFIGLVFDRLDK